MKVNFRPFIKGTNWALAGLLGLLGFACSDNGKGSVDEYGSPWAEYTFKGAVTDQSGKPVGGIQVSTGSIYYDRDSTVTNAEGAYSISREFSPRDKFTLKAEDIDGEQNGSFQTDSVEVTIRSDEYKNPDSWYKGAVEKEVPTIVLKEKETGTDE